MVPVAEIRVDKAVPAPSAITCRLLPDPAFDASDTVTVPFAVSAGCVTTKDTLFVLPFSVS
ncbi:hypothetical protein ACMA110817_29985 [Achromobacter marplatensis]